MIGRSQSGFRPENLGQNALRMVGNLCFAVFVVVVLIFSVIAAIYHPEDPLLRPLSAKLTSFLTSTSNATFHSDAYLLRTAEDFLNVSTDSSNSAPFIQISDINATAEATASVVVEAAEEAQDAEPQCALKPEDPIDCILVEVF